MVASVDVLGLALMTGGRLVGLTKSADCGAPLIVSFTEVGATAGLGDGADVLAGKALLYFWTTSKVSPTLQKSTTSRLITSCPYVVLNLSWQASKRSCKLRAAFVTEATLTSGKPAVQNDSV